MKKKTVLIVEDELDMRIFISTLLETSGYRPIMTRDGNEGMLKAKDVCPDLIILDVMMPGEGGVQGCLSGSHHFRCDDARRRRGSDVPAAKNP
jgi:DNA-binding response OmpR family regulator